MGEIVIQKLIGILFVGLFALAYMVITHFLMPIAGASISQLNYGLIIGALFWILLSLKKEGSN